VKGENVKKWRLLFEDGMTNVHAEQRCGRKFFVTKNLKETGNAQFWEGRKFTISELYKPFPAVSLSDLQVVKERLRSRNTTHFTAGIQNRRRGYRQEQFVCCKTMRETPPP
jgi:hypothetical protein